MTSTLSAFPLQPYLKTTIIQNVPGGKVKVSVILSKKMYVYMCPILNGF
jgi:hypothetical protein